MKEILSDIERWRACGETFAIATVVATRRSAPRPVGAKLAVSAAGELVGSVSGGCVEAEVYGHAREVLAGGAPRLLSYGISDELAFGVGLPCGGEIDVFVAVPQAELVDSLAALVRDQARGVLLTVVEGEELGASLLVPEAGAPVGEASASLLDDAPEALRAGRNRVLEREAQRIFAEVYGPPPRLLVFGAIDTAEALCRLAGGMGWRTIVADPRGKFATAERLPSADQVVVAWPEGALARVRPDRETAIVVLTHDDKLDVPALKGALAAGAFYVGALGSRRNQARRRERLLEEGVAEDQIERIAGPAGLDIGAETPVETALSIMAEILARRAGRAGGALKHAAGRIHVEVGQARPRA